jgi:hypothetical protein
MRSLHTDVDLKYVLVCVLIVVIIVVLWVHFL